MRKRKEFFLINIITIALSLMSTDVMARTVINRSAKKPIANRHVVARAAATNTANPRTNSEKKIRCSVGEYLPANRRSCVECNLSEYECPGGSFRVQNYDQGLIEKNYNFNWVTCKPGTYLPWNNKTCVACPNSFGDINNDEYDYTYCPGGKFPYPSFDQGIRKMFPTYVCKSGEYLPMNTDYCVKCFNDYYCPGGEFTYSPKNDQGIGKSSQIVECEPGTYLPQNGVSCTKCGDDYFCPGGKFPAKPTSDNGRIKNTITCEAGTFLREGDFECSTCDEDTTANYHCPGGIFAVYGASDQGLVEKYTFCDAGQYLPAQSVHCQQCDAKIQKDYYCYGGKFDVSNFDQGLTPRTKIAEEQPQPQYSSGYQYESADEHEYYDDSDDTTGSAMIYCDAGYYLPSNTTSCKPCDDDNHICPGGGFKVSLFAQGISSCNVGQVADSTHTECVKKKYTCVAGYFLPANSEECRACMGALRYCPGGDYEKSVTDQGIYTCPLGGRAIDNGSKCEVVLTKTDMQYGPEGPNAKAGDACWTKTKSVEEYKECLGLIKK